MRLGIGTYAFAWAIGVPGYPPEHPMSVFEFLEKSSALGVDCVQIADNISLHTYSMEQLMQIKQRAISLNLAVEVGMRGLEYSRVVEYLDIARLLQSDILRLVIDAEGFEPSIPDIIGEVNRLIPHLKNANIRLALENHDRLSARDFVQIIEDSANEWIGICLDSVNSLGKGEGFYEVANQLLPYTINLHIKDYTIRRLDHNMGFSVSGTVAGSGMLPLDWLFGEIKKYDQCRSAILELWPAPEKTIEETIAKESEWVESSIKYLKQKRY
jgi:sugar phosphate isomerase/epimerase